MKIALIAAQVGMARTLGSTAFLGAIADGMQRVGVPVKVVSLATAAAGWLPEHLGAVDAVAPCLEAPQWSTSDAAEAVLCGILAEMPPAAVDGDPAPAWYLELLLQRELDTYTADDSDLALLVYPRAVMMLEPVTRIAARRGWRVIVPSSEALTDAQIDTSTRERYIDLVANVCSGIWCLSDYLVRYWEGHGVPAERMLLQPNIVRESSFEQSGDPVPGSAAYLGNLSHREIDYLLDVSSAVVNSVPDYQLSIYGDAIDDRKAELARDIAARGLDGAVSIRQAVSPAEIPQILADTDILLLPRSHGEFSMAGFPNKLGEYLASGRPVVVTRVGDIPKYLVDRESAMLVEPDDCDAFSDAVIEVLRDRELAARIGARGRGVARELLSSPTVANRLLDFIASLPEQTPERVGTGERIVRFLRSRSRPKPAGPTGS